MARLPLSSVLVVCLTFVAGCDAESFSKLTLPDGDVSRGEELFVSYQCTACHTIDDLELARPKTRPTYDIALGGLGRKTYHDLVTAIINPSHSVPKEFRSTDVADNPDSADSPMVVYNDVMSVTDLIDLVAFLESQYKIETIYRYRYVPLRFPP